MVHVLGFHGSCFRVPSSRRSSGQTESQRQKRRRIRGERERERERERGERGDEEKGSARRRRTIKKRRSVVGEGEWRWGSRMRKPSECGSF
jgi:hypothetical protein